jgi:hypothetical protein
MQECHNFRHVFRETIDFVRVDARIQGKEEKGTDIDSLQKKHFDIDCLYHRQGNEQKQVAVHQI